MVGKLKSISNQLDPRRFVFRQHNLNDVESKKNVGIVEQPKPGEPAHRNSFTLVAPQCVERPSEIFVRARFHFDENQRVAIATDDVDFAAAPAAEIAVENFVTAPPKKATGEIFAAFAAPQMRRLRFRARNRKAVAPPAQTIGDGWGRVRTHGV